MMTTMNKNNNNNNNRHHHRQISSSLKSHSTQFPTTTTTTTTTASSSSASSSSFSASSPSYLTQRRTSRRKPRRFQLIYCSWKFGLKCLLFTISALMSLWTWIIIVVPDMSLLLPFTQTSSSFEQRKRVRQQEYANFHAYQQQHQQIHGSYDPNLRRRDGHHFYNSILKKFGNDNYHNNKFTVQLDHSIYTKGPWDQSPIVLPEHNLLLFTTPKVGATILKQWCRKIYGYSNWQVHNKDLPHDPSSNGLTYLYDYPLHIADAMMVDNDNNNNNNTTTTTIKALFVRDPLERALSAYLDKAVRTNYVYEKCCQPMNPSKAIVEFYQRINKPLPENNLPPYCRRDKNNKSNNYNNNNNDNTTTNTGTTISFETFVTQVLPTCNDPHWQPQYLRMESIYWQHVNFIGRFETLPRDLEKLQSKIGIKDNDLFHADSDITTSSHSTSAQSKLSEYYTSNRLIQHVVEYYKADYELELFNFTRPKLLLLEN